ncbi:MAG: coproporphyrinogen dehydrogenase HemZ, partial [Oscillospiraceae bacterium]|nr:coproporphyrinogen dehydrogenase HemZ [Oscillospiraceae bacterium]
MILFIKGLENNYEIEMLSRMFFPQLSLAEDRELSSLCENEDYLFANRDITGENQQLSITLRRNGEIFSESGSMAADAAEREYNLALSRMLYRCAVKSGCDELRWGILTGIRPIKLFHALHAKGMTDNEINAEIKRNYLISDEMAALAQSVRKTEHEINKKSLPMGFSLYISIPFCPQRCSYCSFVSQAVDKMKHLIEPYVEQLCVELKEFGEIAAKLGLTLQTVYFGGGTPTTLSAPRLTKLFETIAANFDLSNLLEYTVEAGRP